MKEEPQIDDSTPDSVNEPDSKVSMTMSFSSDPLPEPAQAARHISLSPGQLLPSTTQSPILGVIGRRSVSDLGAIGDNLSETITILPSPVPHDQHSTLHLLESAYRNLLQPKDSERTRSYTPRHPTVTPQHYPQVQAPVVNNPVFWERLGYDNIGTDTLFYSFYHQQIRNGFRGLGT